MPTHKFILMVVCKLLILPRICIKQRISVTLDTLCNHFAYINSEAKFVNPPILATVVINSHLDDTKRRFIRRLKFSINQARRIDQRRLCLLIWYLKIKKPILKKTVLFAIELLFFLMLINNFILYDLYKRIKQDKDKICSVQSYSFVIFLWFIV